MGLISNVIATKWKSGEFGIAPNWLAKNTRVRIGGGIAIAGGAGYHLYNAISACISNPIAAYGEMTLPIIAGAAVLIAAVTTEISVMRIGKAKEPDKPKAEAKPAPDAGAKQEVDKKPELDAAEKIDFLAGIRNDLEELAMLAKEQAELADPAKLMENAAASKPDSLATMIAKICAHDISTLDTGLDIVELFLKNREMQRWTRQYVDSLILIAQAFFGEIKNTSDLPNFNSFNDVEKLHRAAMVTNALVIIFRHMGYGPEEDEEKEPFPQVIEHLRKKAEAVGARSSRED